MTLARSVSSENSLPVYVPANVVDLMKHLGLTLVGSVSPYACTTAIRMTENSALTDTAVLKGRLIFIYIIKILIYKQGTTLTRFK